MEIEVTDLLISLLVVALLISIILSFRSISIQKSIVRRTESDAHFNRSKLIQIEFEVKDFKRTFQMNSVQNRKNELARNRFETGDTISKIQPFVASKTQEKHLENVP